MAENNNLIHKINDEQLVNVTLESKVSRRNK